ncbi:hypothetical protein [Bremerella sp.]|uniref:hypothetical protein n=1 Tax=Bremerella sp. TaxID=2795602 RepID=UPI00391C688B
MEIPDELLKEPVPSDYLEVIRDIGGQEGFIGRQYLRLYRCSELISLNEAYQVRNYNPDLFLFGADGYGEAFAFVFGTNTIVKIPLIPIPLDKADFVAEGFEEFLKRLAQSGESPELDDSQIGLEIHLKQPLCLGGDFRDPDNRVLVTPSKHAELARYWNQLYYDLLKRQQETE